MIRRIRLDDAKQIADLYNYYIKNTVVTFEEKIVPPSEFERRIKENDPKLPWLVVEENNEILAYAYASKWKARSAYRHSVETTIYLREDVRGKGLGTLLYSELISILKTQNIHAIIGGVTLPNQASVALHEKMGYEKVAHFKEVGFKFGKWLDVGYWELILD